MIKKMTKTTMDSTELLICHLICLNKLIVFEEFYICFCIFSLPLLQALVMKGWSGLQKSGHSETHDCESYVLFPSKNSP